jgi:hypothetical protein
MLQEKKSFRGLIMNACSVEFARFIARPATPAPAPSGVARPGGNGDGHCQEAFEENEK